MHPIFIWTQAGMWQGCLGACRVPCSQPSLLNFCSRGTGHGEAQPKSNPSGLSQITEIITVARPWEWQEKQLLGGDALQELTSGGLLASSVNTAKADSMNLKPSPCGVSLYFIIPKEKSSLLWTPYREESVSQQCLRAAAECDSWGNVVAVPVQMLGCTRQSKITHFCCVK